MIDLGLLNDEQRLAVETTEGPVLVLAGAGTGKTRVITYRTAHLIDKGVSPRNILAVTFTNKAANEMKERVRDLVGRDARSMAISTFHSFCAKILREEIEKLGYKKNFVIYDMSDQIKLMQSVLREIKVAGMEFEPQGILYKVSSAKNRLLDPENLAEEATDLYDEVVISAYKKYQESLMSFNALDFDDLLMLTVKLFKDYKESRKKYQNQFLYIMVDEYQDTNHAQYQLVKQLTYGRRCKNVCVVGDDDQSIYQWRGADLGNILNFERDFRGAKVIKLEQNYRSPSIILKAANSVIANNLNRKEKSLWSSRGPGRKIECIEAQDGNSEADIVAGRIADLHHRERIPYGDCAVLYRTNAQSRPFEEKLRFSGIPYVVVGGMRFYDRKEVKDIIAYMKVLVNVEDEISLLRIINCPARGIGRTTVNKIKDYAIKKGISIYEALREQDKVESISASTRERIRAFVKMINRYREAINQASSINQILKRLIDEVGYREELERTSDNAKDAKVRIEVVEEIVSAVSDYERNEKSPTIDGFLEKIALMTEEDDSPEVELSKNSATLMTLHGCKGLEFPYVFLVGMEEDLLPHKKSSGDDGEFIDEERRLCYVGITRAQEHLVLTYAKERSKYGQMKARTPSRFLKEIPESLMIWNLCAEEKEASEEMADYYLSSIKEMLNAK